jgi:hypothetical protein
MSVQDDPIATDISCDSGLITGRGFAATIILENHEGFSYCCVTLTDTSRKNQNFSEDFKYERRRCKLGDIILLLDDLVNDAVIRGMLKIYISGFLQQTADRFANLVGLKGQSGDAFKSVITSLER